MSSQLEAVSNRLAGSIQEFCQARVGQMFHMEELRDFIAAKGVRCAPNSPYRIMYDLRKRGLIAYSVVSRMKSQYHISAA